MAKRNYQNNELYSQGWKGFMQNSQPSHTTSAKARGQLPAEHTYSDTLSPTPTLLPPSHDKV